MPVAQQTHVPTAAPCNPAAPLTLLDPCPVAVGRGVVGYCEVDFLQAAPDGQDFKQTPVLAKLEVGLGVTQGGCDAGWL